MVSPGVSDSPWVNLSPAGEQKRGKRRRSTAAAVTVMQVERDLVHTQVHQVIR
jgi:hypothetical protein